MGEMLGMVTEIDVLELDAALRFARRDGHVLVRDAEVGLDEGMRRLLESLRTAAPTA